MFAATVVVRIAGFGGSLVAMPLLIPLIGLHAASPLMNLFGMTTFSVTLYQQWQELTFRDMARVMATAVIATPFGVYLLFIIPEPTLRLVLGIICISYATYRLFKLPNPNLTHPHWGWLFGTIAGLFSGAFNVGGVPAVIYATAQEWQPERFRLNMFSFLLIISSFGLISRYAAGQLTSTVISYWLFTTPFMLIGLAVGKYLTRFVNQKQFQTLVLLLLLVLGARLIATAG